MVHTFEQGQGSPTNPTPEQHTLCEPGNPACCKALIQLWASLVFPFFQFCYSMWLIMNNLNVCIRFQNSVQTSVNPLNKFVREANEYYHFHFMDDKAKTHKGSSSLYFQTSRWTEWMNKWMNGVSELNRASWKFKRDLFFQTITSLASVVRYSGSGRSTPSCRGWYLTLIFMWEVNSAWIWRH